MTTWTTTPTQPGAYLWRLREGEPIDLLQIVNGNLGLKYHSMVDGGNGWIDGRTYGEFLSITAILDACEHVRLLESRSFAANKRLDDLERRVAAIEKQPTACEAIEMYRQSGGESVGAKEWADELAAEPASPWKCPTCGEGMYSAIPGLIRCMKCNPQSPARIEHNLCSSCGMPAGAGREANCSNEFHAPQKGASGLMALVARWRHLAKVYDDGRAKQYLECADELEAALRTTSEQPK